jgi:hypothetical protein
MATAYGKSPSATDPFGLRSEIDLQPARIRLSDSEAAFSILLVAETKPRTYFNEVDVQTLVSSTIFAKAVALKVLEVYSPALFVRRVGCEVMLGPRRPLADSSDVLSDINRQIAYVVRIPRILLMCCAGFGKSWEFAAKKKANSQQ